MLNNESITKLLGTFKETIKVCQTVSNNIHAGMPKKVLDEDQSSLYQQIAKAIAVIQETEAMLSETEDS